MSDAAPPPNDPEGGPPPPSRVPPPPLEPAPALGLDRAWAALTPAGRFVVSVLAVLLVVAAAVGIGLAASGDGGGDGPVVIAETAAEGVTLEVPQDTFPATTDEIPATTDDFPEPPVETEAPPVATDPAATSETPADTSGVTTPPDDSGGEASAPTQSFSSDQGDIGAITVDAPSTLAWTSDGDSIVLLDLKSGATLVDSTDSSGEVDLEPADYDVLVTAGGSWTVEIRPR